MTKRCILYARVSGDDRQNKTSSIDAQLAECRKYAGQRCYDIVSEVFEDPTKHTSGADWLPELDKVIKLATSRTFDVLICREVDRLARNRFKQLATEIELESHGVVVEYAIGQYANSDEGRLLKGLVSEFAEYERGKIRRRTQAGRVRSVEAGNVNTGASGSPYGYDVVTQAGKRSLCINAQEAEIVRLIFDLYVDKGYSLYQIGDYLDSHQVPLPTKAANHKSARKFSEWTVATIFRLLSQEVYVGRWYYRKTRHVKNAKTGKMNNVPRPHEEWLMVPVPAIISEDIFDAAQRRKELNKHQMGHQKKHLYSLGGMIKCGRCHAYVSGTAKMYKNSEYRTYKCNAKHNPKSYGFHCTNVPFKASTLEAAVWNWIKSLLMEPAILRRSIEEYQATQRESVRPHLAMLESSQARLAELEVQKTRLIDAYAKGILSLDELAGQKSALDKQIADLSQAVASLRSEAEPLLLSAEQIKSIEAIPETIRAGAAAADNDIQGQRKIFQLLDVKVVLDHDGERRWADVTCYLGTQRCTVEFSRTVPMQNYCVIHARLWL